MYKTCYEREARLYMEEARRQAAHNRLVHRLMAGRPPVYAPLLAALGRLLTRAGERLEAREHEPQEQYSVLEPYDAFLTG